MEAVLIEPVSTSNFPANREINREFCEFRPSCTILAPNQGGHSMACRIIPYAMEQGHNRGVTGNFFQRTGNYRHPIRYTAPPMTFSPGKWPRLTRVARGLQGGRQAFRNRAAVWNFAVRCQEGACPGTASRSLIWLSLVNHKIASQVRHLRLTVVVKRSEIAVGQPHGNRAVTVRLGAKFEASTDDMRRGVGPHWVARPLILWSTTPTRAISRWGASLH